jgi:HEAT repeat protein
VRLLQLATYLDAVHIAADHRLRATTLSRLGYVARGMPFAASGMPGSAEVKLATLLGRTRGMLLLGDDGSGKSTALADFAHGLSSRRNLFPIAFGRRPLPVSLSLEWFARVTSGSADALPASVAHQLRAFGASQLALRSIRALRHWNMVLLCDGLDEIPAAQRPEVAERLAVALGRAYPEARLVVTSSLGAYLTDSARLASLNALERVVLTGVPTDQAPRLVRHGVHSARARSLAARFAEQTTQAHGLGSQVSHPATLAALVIVLGAEQATLPGRGHLLRAYADVLCARAGDGARAEQVGRLMESLAGALRANNVAAIPHDPSDSAASAVRHWLERTSGPQATSRQDLDLIVAAALRCGLLDMPRGADCIRFAARSVEAVFAALALERFSREAPSRPLPADLLEPQWCEPVLLWAGFGADPGWLAQRVLELPVSAGEWTTAAPALALAAALEAFAPALAGQPHHDAATAPEAAGQQLRPVLDEVARRAPGAKGQQALIQQLAVIERYGLVDLTSHLVTLAQCGALSRIVRAQAIELLGGIASPASLDGLLELLPETDAVLRGAVDRAFASAGPLAVPRLQRTLGSEDERLRLRALEALGQGREGGIATIAAATTSEGAQEREIAARALGALRATDAIPALTALLDDRAEAVRLATIEALGRMGTTEAIPPLIAHAGAAQASVRAAIAAALGETRDATVLALLLTMLGDEVATVRAAAAEALGKLGDELAVQPLREHLGDTDPWAQASAATALRRLGRR